MSNDNKISAELAVYEMADQLLLRGLGQSNITDDNASVFMEAAKVACRNKQYTKCLRYAGVGVVYAASPEKKKEMLRLNGEMAVAIAETAGIDESTVPDIYLATVISSEALSDHDIPDAKILDVFGRCLDIFAHKQAPEGVLNDLLRYDRIPGNFIDYARLRLLPVDSLKN